jgi:hypothetical protein
VHREFNITHTPLLFNFFIALLQYQFPGSMTNKKITWKYNLAVIAVVIFTWVIHEFAHWLTAEFLGYESVMRINGVSPVKAETVTGWHKIYISAAGPVVTILQGVLAFLLLKRGSWNKYIYAFLFTALYMRLLAGIMNVINPNDEGRISIYFELGTFTLPLLVSAFLFYLVYSISQKYSPGGRFPAGTDFAGHGIKFGFDPFRSILRDKDSLKIRKKLREYKTRKILKISFRQRLFF